MKRWLLAGLLGLAILVFLSPGIIGMLAERSLKEQLKQENSPGSEPAVRELNFARGWFASEGRHRVPIADPGLARFLAQITPGADRPEELPALIIETRLEHGLVPLGSAPRDASSLLPALASGVSTLSLELPNGSVLPVPGVLYSRIGLTGNATFRYELPPGDETRDTVRLTWQASDVNVSSNIIGRELSLEANVAGALAKNHWQHLEFSEARVAGNVKATPYGFPAGDAHLRIADVDWITGPIADRWDLLDVTASSALQGDAVEGDLRFTMLGFETAEGPFDIELVAKATEVNAELLAPIIRALQHGDGNVQLSSSEPYPGFDTDLRRLLSSGATLHIDELQLRTPSGNGQANITLSLPALDEVAGWPGLLLALTGNTDLEIARTRVEAPSPITDQLRLLIASGVLVLDGDVYRLKASVSKGKVTINGAPMVIPSEWLQ